MQGLRLHWDKPSLRDTASDRRRVGSAVTVLWLLAILFPGVAAGAPVPLQKGTATFSQGDLDGVGPYSPEQAIDGIMSGPYGWTIDHFPNNDPSQEYTTNETAVWQTVPDLGPSLLTFTMYFEVANPFHLLGRFRLSVTTDDRSTYADGLASGGNVTANWTVLKNLAVLGPSGMTFTNLADDSVLAGGTVPGQGVYVVSGVANLTGITGIRLEVLKDPSLPRDGPGFAANGNFVLTEIQLTAAPLVIPVAIDIKPGSLPNSINLTSNGVVPVAVLSSPTFNVVDVDVNTVKFAGASAEKFSYADVNSDGLVDLVFHFRTQHLKLTPRSTQATLTGNLRDGTPISGTDSVRIVPPK